MATVIAFAPRRAARRAVIDYAFLEEEARRQTVIAHISGLFSEAPPAATPTTADRRRNIAQTGESEILTLLRRIDRRLKKIAGAN